MIPPDKKTTVENKTPRVAVRMREQFQAGEQERNHDGGEYFKEAFDPKVNNPPAPVFGGDQIAALAVHQSSGVEKRDRDAGDDEHHQAARGCSSFLAKAGLRPRHISHSQKTRPTNSKICQRRPKSTYS